MRVWWRRWGIHRGYAAWESEYHDEGMPLYEIETYWAWRGHHFGSKTRVLA